jgi:hypothetical protein
MNMHLGVRIFMLYVYYFMLRRHDYYAYAVANAKCYYCNEGYINSCGITLSDNMAMLIGTHITTDIRLHVEETASIYG